jgi:tRNA nucleotidyltransferase/poly(A) polymerase
MISPLEAGAVRICGTLRSAGYEAYLAGGCVRDRLMGREPKDYDVATSARPEDIEGLFPHVFPVGKAFGVMLVIEEEGTYEVATFRTDGPYSDGRHPDSVDFADAESDALRRDFTVNALFLDPERDRVIDFVRAKRI